MKRTMTLALCASWLSSLGAGRALACWSCLQEAALRPGPFYNSAESHSFGHLLGGIDYSAKDINLFHGVTDEQVSEGRGRLMDKALDVSAGNQPLRDQILQRIIRSLNPDSLAARDHQMRELSAPVLRRMVQEALDGRVLPSALTDDQVQGTLAKALDARSQPSPALRLSAALAGRLIQAKGPKLNAALKAASDSATEPDAKVRDQAQLALGVLRPAGPDAERRGTGGWDSASRRPTEEAVRVSLRSGEALSGDPASDPWVAGAARMIASASLGREVRSEALDYLASRLGRCDSDEVLSALTGLASASTSAPEENILRARASEMMGYASPQNDAAWDSALRALASRIDPGNPDREPFLAVRVRQSAALVSSIARARQAGRKLSSFSDPTTIAALGRTLAHEPSGEARRDAAVALGLVEAKDEKAAAALRRALDSSREPDPLVRAAAARSLGLLRAGDEQTLGAFTASLDPSREACRDVRCAAAEALAQAGEPQGFFLLRHALKTEKDEGLRRGIERALRLLEAEISSPKDAASAVMESPEAAEWPDPLSAPPVPPAPPAPTVPSQDPGGWVSPR